MDAIFNKRNMAVAKFLAVLGLVLYIIFKAIPKLKEEPSGMLLSATIIGAIGFSISLFKLGKEIRKENAKHISKSLTVKSNRDKAIKRLNTLGVLLVVFMLFANQTEILPKTIFVYLYIAAAIVLLAIIVLNILKKKDKQITSQQ